MSQIWIKEFVGGLDTRRLPETTPGGVLIKATDCHVTRGGELEKRAAFVPFCTLPAGTVGLARDRRGLVVFGHETAPESVPKGVTYQRLEHPTGLALVAVPSYDLFDGKVYAVGQFSDGSIYHFYDGVIVEDWFDGRARASFTITAGTGADEMTDLTVGGVSIFTAPVPWATSNAATAAAIAAEINSNISVPEYTATAVGASVNITAVEQGPTPNGLAVVPTLTGAFAVTPASGLALADGSLSFGTTAQASFRIAGGQPGATITLSVNGVNLTSAPVVCGETDAETAAFLVAAVNAFTSSPAYTAASIDPADPTLVVLNTVDDGEASNGLTPEFVFTGLPASDGATASASFTISGVSLEGRSGSEAEGETYVITSTIRPRLNGLAMVAAPVSANTLPAGSDPLTTRLATAVAAAMTDASSVTGYTATSSGATVTVTTTALTAAANGLVMTFEVQGVVTLSGITAFSGGADPLSAGVAVADVTPFAGGAGADVFIPGTFVRTIKSKMYSVSDSLFHFSGIQEPTQWTTDTAGAGFVNMATQNSGSEELTAVARYQNLVAIFSPEVVQIWFVDPDPNLNTVSQVLENTGTSCPQSVTQFGDSDVFYLDDSGVRSLRARDSSNSASTTDIGVPIDSLVTAKMEGLTETERARVVGLINPVDRRFWLILKDEIFVFSFYENAKVSAWTTYNTTTKTTAASEDFMFEVDAAAVFGGRPYLRSGNVVFAYGGVDPAIAYDWTEAEVWLPYLDANRPAAPKAWTGVDAALTGQWQISAAMNPNDLEQAEVVARVFETTYNAQRIAFNHTSSHVSIRAKSTSDGPAVLGSMVVHFMGDEEEA